VVEMTDVYTFEKFHRLTLDEFTLLKGTELMAQMLTNKWYTDSEDVIDLLDDHATGAWCAMKHGDGYLVYLSSVSDIMLARQYVTPETVPAPAITSINIADEFTNT